MLLCALDKITKQLILAQNSQKQTNYVCLICGQNVRFRRRFFFQRHFYHCNTPKQCHARPKSLVHSQVQYQLQQILPGSQLESRFPKSQRIADVVWWPQYLVFEIQCSNISVRDVLARNMAYKKIGLDVIWILHDQCFNKKKTTPAERALENSPHYFTNIDANGKGYFYDQYSKIINHKRYILSPPLPIDLTTPRHSKSKIYFAGDLTDQINIKQINIQNIKTPNPPPSLYHKIINIILSAVCKN
jgi:competence protein CoiA